ncbi:MAG: glycoside hydrolase 43 family protein [Opitutae bacterium]|nr:glycoside hydrolase 43 family protein [Opitutae bacterium]
MRSTWVAPGYSMALVVQACAFAPTWTADNGNGTFTNPLFYDEFSDPDLIRVGEDYYLTGTTMHAMPGLPVLHSRDLVNWRLLGYACERLDLGPEYRLAEGKEAYGQGIWAPCLRYHDGTWHIFANVNRHGTQHFTAKNPAGPWTRTPMKRSLHDLSVLFDDDGRVYAVWGYQEIRIAQLNADLTDVVPGTERTLIEKAAGMGEGVHFYKFDGRYFITSAWWDGRMRLVCARADRLEGPWEVNRDISIDEDFGLAEGNRLWKTAGPPFDVQPGNPASRGRLSLHQGGFVVTPCGEWWGFAMTDANSVGRLTCLSPVTWRDGWPYFGLPGNLRRTPRTWLKPNTGHEAPPSAPYSRDDDFAGPQLANVWQWNHVPDDTQRSLAERPGFLRLHAQAAPDFWRARNTLTQRAVGPQSSATTVLDASGLRDGDVAGLALLNLPYAWIGVRRDGGAFVLEKFDQRTGKTSRVPLSGGRVWLRVRCDFLKEVATFSYSLDGTAFAPLGTESVLVFQLKTFQGVRFALFAFNDSGSSAGGKADFDSFTVDEPRPRGLMRPIPFGRTIRITAHGTDLALGVKDGVPAVVSLSEGRASRPDEPRVDSGSSGTTRPTSAPAAELLVEDIGRGRVALRTGDGRALTVVDGRVTLAAEVRDAAAFQWIETLNGDLILLSLATNRYVRFDPASGAILADGAGPDPSRADGVCLDWQLSPP